MDCIGSRSASCHIIEQVQWELATITVKVTPVSVPNNKQLV